MRTFLAIAGVLMLAGCAAEPRDALWPGPDWLTTYPPGTAAAEIDAGRVDKGEIIAPDAIGTRVPRERTRRGSSTPPDVLFENPTQPRRPQVALPSVTPAPMVEPRNDVLAPRDANRPYSADGYGYQRQGNTVIGPQGETYNRVGSSLIGPGGKACSVVGSSVMC